MKKLFGILVIGLCSGLTSSAGIVGEWTAYPAFGYITEMETQGTRTYVLTTGGMYSYNTYDMSVTTYDKTKTLSDSGISHIGWCQVAKRLVIVYSNQNIDLLEENNNVINISDFYSKTLTYDKTVYGLNVSGKYAYLSTGFGIVKVNVEEGNISDTYNIGIKVKWTHVDSQRIYAESEDSGQYSALLTSNLSDKASWTRTAGYTAENKKISDEQRALAETYKPNSPVMNYFGYMKIHNNKLYTVTGYGINDCPAYIQIKDGDKWSVITNNISYISSRKYVQPYKIEVDPNDDNHWFVPARTGLYEYRDGKVIKDYYCDNSPLQRAATVSAPNVDYTLTTSAIFDSNEDLWVFNGIASNPYILKLDASGNWTTYSHPELLNSAGYSWERQESAFFDSRGLLWFVDNDWRAPALAYYKTDSDELKTYTTIINEDGSKVSMQYARCCAEDKDHNIWLGTDLGPVELLSSDIASDNDVFQQIKVPRDDGTGLADYLLAGIDISCMAIDGANRKWFGTNGHGVYLIGSDNITQIHHFTADDSPLLSDNIESIAIDNNTGEVYFGTSKGLCSYASDASGEAEELVKDNVYVYPNPVTPDYTGLITVKGLTYNANVKIVTSAGSLVAEGLSNGGSFTWDGLDMDGNRVVSGVYIVLVTTQDGKKGIVTKIGIVR